MTSTSMKNLRWLAVFGALVTVIVVLTSAPAAAQSRLPATSPVGTWTGEVTWPGRSAEVTLSFHPNGHVCLVSPPPGPDGGVEGTGAWKKTAADRFSFQLTERFYGTGGKTTGWLRTDQAEVTVQTQFTLTGTAHYYDPNWRELDTVRSTVRLRHTSPRPVSC